MVQQILEPPRSGRTSPPGVASYGDVLALDALLDDLSRVDGRVRSDVDPDAVRVELLDRLERVKAAAAAASLRVVREFRASQIQRQHDAGVRPERLGRGVSDQVALACRLTPHQGQYRLSLATALAQMPHTEALLADGSISEWVATLLARETSHLTADHRAEVDRRLCEPTPEGGPAPVIGLSPRRVASRARGLADRLDVAAAVARAANATSDRGVWVRPAPDTMAYLTALLPVAQAVACFAHLTGAAGAAKADGDPRSKAQVMADTLVEQLTGQAEAAAIPLEIGLVMTPDSLIGASEEPARLPDGSLLPAPLARDLARRGDAPRWLRRVFTDPITGVVTDLDRARRRIYGGLEARVIDARDQHCRQPSCDSQVTHRDHIERKADGGPTTVSNGERLCPPHNQTRELPGWRFAVTDARPGHHEVTITTPTGHTYSTTAPPALPP